MANGLPLEGYSLGAGKLNLDLPDLAPATRLPLDTGGVSTGRAADIAPSGAAPGGGPDIAGMLNYEPTTRDRWAAFFHGIGSNDPGATGKYLNALTETKRKAGMDLLNYQINFAREIREGRTQTMAATEKVFDLVSTTAPKLSAMSPDEVETTLKGLEQIAEEGGARSAKALVRPLAKNPDLAAVVPGLLQLIPRNAQQVIGLQAPKAIAEGRMPSLLWANALPELQRQLNQEAEQELDALSLEPAYRDQPVPYDVLMRRITRGDRIREMYIDRTYGGTAGKEIDAARDAFDRRLAQKGVALPSTAAKAQETAATTAAQKRAGLAPDIVKGEAAAAAEKAAATKRVELAPEIVALEARRTAVLEETKEQVKARYDVTKPLTATEAGTMRSQFLAQSKDFTDTLRAYQRVEDAVKDPSAAGDIAALFGYMKMLDPGSVVRESEFATAQNAAGVPEQIRNTWNRLMSGKRLGEEGSPTREDIADRARRLVKGQLGQHEQVEGEFKRIAGKRRGDPGEVVPDLVGALRQTIKAQGPGSRASETVSRASADYKKAQARGLSDAEIERRYKVKVTD